VTGGCAFPAEGVGKQLSLTGQIWTCYVEEDDWCGARGAICSAFVSVREAAGPAQPQSPEG
jgi:hypothetical protein